MESSQYNIQSVHTVVSYILASLADIIRFISANFLVFLDLGYKQVVQMKDFK